MLEIMVASYPIAEIAAISPLLGTLKQRKSHPNDSAEPSDVATNTSTDNANSDKPSPS